MISDVTRLAHDLMPAFNQKITVQYTQAIKASVAVVEALLSESVRSTEYSLYWKNGHRYLAMTVVGTHAGVSKVGNALLSNHALYQEMSDTVTITDGKQERKLEVVFSSFRGLDHVVTIPTSVAEGSEQEYWAYINKCSGDMSEVVHNTILLADSIADSDEYSVRWFVDRLPLWETPGEHILALQNFMYRVNTQFR